MSKKPDLLGVAQSEMAQRVRDFDWSATPLGPIESWPQSLLIAVSICLNSRFPMFVWWGPKLINIYNDGYIPMLGARHPRALGHPSMGPSGVDAQSNSRTRVPISLATTLTAGAG